MLGRPIDHARFLYGPDHEVIKDVFGEPIKKKYIGWIPIADRCQDIIEIGSKKVQCELYANHTEEHQSILFLKGKEMKIKWKDGEEPPSCPNCGFWGYEGRCKVCGHNG